MKLIEMFMLFDTVSPRPGAGLCDLVALDNDNWSCKGMACSNCPLGEARGDRYLKEALYESHFSSEPDG